jgi:hypothetical protein
MESYGEPGRIQVSEATYLLIKDDFHCVEREALEINRDRDHVNLVAGRPS